MSKTLLIAGIVFLFASAGFFMYKQLKNINQNQVHFHNRISELEKRMQGLTTALTKKLAPPQPKQVEAPVQNQAEQEKDAEEKEIVIEEIDAEKEKEE